MCRRHDGLVLNHPKTWAGTESVRDKISAFRLDDAATAAVPPEATDLPTPGYFLLTPLQGDNPPRGACALAQRRFQADLIGNDETADSFAKPTGASFVRLFRAKLRV
jgi:hypothetical protein